MQPAIRVPAKMDASDLPAPYVTICTELILNDLHVEDEDHERYANDKDKYMAILSVCYAVCEHMIQWQRASKEYSTSEKLDADADIIRADYLQRPAVVMAWKAMLRTLDCAQVNASLALTSVTDSSCSDMAKAISLHFKQLVSPSLIDTFIVDAFDYIVENDPYEPSSDEEDDEDDEEDDCGEEGEEDEEDDN